ncbi:MAG: right-handed parallel beta-helix repeat-containing protein [Candidatus Thermoplasmatota archaeon]
MKKICIFLLLLTLYINAKSEATEDLEITGMVIENDKFIEMNKNIIIKQTGSYILKNVTLNINSKYDGELKILVEKGGKISMKNSRIKTNTTYYYKFFVYGSAHIENSTIEKLWGNEDRKYFGGLIVDSGDIEIYNSTIKDSKYTGLTINSSIAKIEASKFASNGWDGIYMHSSRVNIIDTTIENNRWHGLSFEKSSLTIKGNKILTNGKYGIYGFESNANITLNEISSNEVGIYIKKSEFLISENFIEKNREDGIFSVDASPTITKNKLCGNSGFGINSSKVPPIISENYICDENLLGFIQQSWLVSVRVIDLKGSAQSNATLLLISNEYSFLEKTNSTGYAVLVLPGYKIMNNGTNQSYIYSIYISKKISGIELKKSDKMSFDNNKEITYILGLPDLSLSKLSISKKSIWRGEKVSLNVKVQNIGAFEARNVGLSFYSDGVLIGKKIIEKIDINETIDVKIDWDTTFVSKGRHKIRVVVDEKNETPEIDETNNKLSEFVTIEDIGTFLGIPILILIVLVIYSSIKLRNWWLIRKIEKKSKDQNKANQKT